MAAPEQTAALQTELRALLLTDAVDSTKLTLALGDAAMARHWTAHDRVARDLLPTWRGREIDKTDGMLLLFDNAADAAGYALAYHRALATIGLPFKSRAGIHVGEVTLRSNPPEDVARGAKPVEVDGIALPIAARVMSAALGGQTLMTGAARVALGETRLRLQSHGHWRLQGLSEPVELFEVGDADAPFMPPRDETKVYRVVRQGELWQPVREVKHSLPAERDSFVGRREPLQALARKLDKGARLVSVLGMGGTGKTRLVTRFGWTWLGDYPGGVWFCDLSQARSVDGIFFAVAQGLDVPLSETDPAVQLAHAIRGRGRCLMILDNFEQVARHAEETLGRWMERAPEASFVVTSREVLGIVGEATLALEPLPKADATALFLRRADAAGWERRADADDLAAIAQLVTVLDGLPLAIELAAARARTMPPRTMLARMHERFSVLLSRAGRRDRQATLRAAFDWSWELLSESERSVLAELSVFRGGFTLEAAASVVTPPAARDAPGSVDLVHWLVDKSFVRQVTDERFDLLESVREYAAEHLRTEGRFAGSGPAALAAAESRHGRHFAQLGPRQVRETLGLELDNLVSASRRAAARGDTAVAVQTLAGAWWGALQLRGPFRVGVELAETVAAVAGLDGKDRAETELMLGDALQLSGRAAEAARHLEAAVQLSQQVGERILEGHALQLLAPMQARSGRVEQAHVSFERALIAFREGDDPFREVALHNAIGGFFETQGRLGDARHHYEHGLRIARETGNRRWEGGSAGNLASFFVLLGRFEQARPLYVQAMQIAAELGDRQWEANAHCNLGLLHFMEGRLTDARVELEAAHDAAREMGHAGLLSVVQCNLGLVEEALGDPDRALQHHEAAVALARDLDDHRSEGQFLGYLGVLHARQQRVGPARECLTRGEALLRSVSDSISLGIVLCARAEAEYRAGSQAAAEAALAEAERLAGELSDVTPESELGQALRRTRELIAEAV